MNMRRLLGCLTAIVCAARVLPAAAQDAPFPSKSIRIVVSSAPGALTDVATRLYAAQMAAVLKQAIVVEDLAGASSVLAARHVAKASADGYTLLATANTIVTIPYVSQKAGYLPRDFVAVGELVRSPALLVVGGASPFKSLADLVGAARQGANKIAYASGGLATTSHLPVELFARQAGVSFIHVPYKGVSAAVPDVAAGRVDFMAGTATSFSKLMKSGALRALAITSAERSLKFPNVPTFKELGYPEASYEIWISLLAPAGTPAAVRSRLAEAMEVARGDATLVNKLEGLGQTVSTLKTPDQADAYLREEEAKVRKLIKDIKLTLD